MSCRMLMLNQTVPRSACDCFFLYMEFHISFSVRYPLMLHSGILIGVFFFRISA